MLSPGAVTEAIVETGAQSSSAVVQRIAEAVKEGGFLGFDGTRVSEEETAALADLAAALGTTVA